MRAKKISLRAMRSAVALAMIALLAWALSVPVQPSLLAQSQPVLQVSPTSLSFESQGGPTPDPQALTISNSGGGLLEWHASTDVEWITLGATEGKLSGGRVIQLLILVDTAGLTAGKHQGTITISAPGAQGSPVHVAVTLTLTAPPKLEVSPASLQFQGEEGGPNPEPQMLTIHNGGGGLLSWAAQADARWLHLSPTSGTAPTTVTVTVHLAGLQAGSYQGRITVSAIGAQGSPVTLAATLTITSGRTSSTYHPLSLQGTWSFTATYTDSSDGNPSQWDWSAPLTLNADGTVGPGSVQGFWWSYSDMLLSSA